MGVGGWERYLACWSYYTPLYEKGIKENQNRPTETTIKYRHLKVFEAKMVEKDDENSPCNQM